LNPKASFQKREKTPPFPRRQGQRGKCKTIYFIIRPKKEGAPKPTPGFKSKPENDTFSPDQKDPAKTKDHPFYRMATLHLCILYTKQGKISKIIIAQSPP